MKEESEKEKSNNKEIEKKLEKEKNKWEKVTEEKNKEWEQKLKETTITMLAKEEEAKTEYAKLLSKHQRLEHFGAFGTKTILSAGLEGIVRKLYNKPNSCGEKVKHNHRNSFLDDQRLKERLTVSEDIEWDVVVKVLKTNDDNPKGE